MAKPAILVDSTVILDLVARHPRALRRARALLAAWCGTATPCCDLPTYTEVALAFRDPAAIEEALAALGLRHRPLPREAAFLAGRAFFAHRRKGGTQRRPSTEFLVGAHAVVDDLPLLTRRPALYRRHFPHIAIRCPDAQGPAPGAA